MSTRATWHLRLRPTRCTCSFIERTEGSRREPRPRARTPVTQPQATASGVEAEPFWSRAVSTEPPTCGATRCHHACQRHPSTCPNALDELRGFIPRPTNLGHRQLPRIARALSAAADGLATRSDGMPSHALGSTHRHTGVGTRSQHPCRLAFVQRDDLVGILVCRQREQLPRDCRLLPPPRAAA